MKRIGILSDTHIPETAPDLPRSVYKELQNVDMILHAGDFVEMAVVQNLKKLAPTHAVYGNMDMPEVKGSLPEKDIVQISGYKIGLIHGYGPPSKIIEALSSEFNNVDVLVFGHTHSPINERIKNTLFFNPGSPTDKIFAVYNSIGILEIGEEIKGIIVRI